MAIAKYSGTSTPAPERAFFYVDGIPTKGAWLELEALDSWHTVREALASRIHISKFYDGDILVADIEGVVAERCYSCARPVHRRLQLRRWVCVHEFVNLVQKRNSSASLRPSAGTRYPAKVCSDVFLLGILLGRN